MRWTARALLVEAAGENIVAAPAALIGRHFAEARDVGLHRPHQSAVAGCNRLDGARQMVDAAHYLELFLRRHVGVLVPVGFRLDEEGGPARIAVRSLDHQVLAQLGGARELHQFTEGFGAAHGVGSALDARLVAELGGGDLRIDVLPELRGRQGDLLAQFLGERLGLLVEHHQ